MKKVVCFLFGKEVTGTEICKGNYSSTIELDNVLYVGKHPFLPETVKKLEVNEHDFEYL